MRHFSLALLGRDAPLKEDEEMMMKRQGSHGQLERGASSGWFWRGKKNMPKAKWVERRY